MLDFAWFEGLGDSRKAFGHWPRRQENGPELIGRGDSSQREMFSLKF
jgi:hypothetical protein